MRDDFNYRPISGFARQVNGDIVLIDKVLLEYCVCKRDPSFVSNTVYVGMVTEFGTHIRKKMIIPEIERKYKGVIMR